MTKFEHRATSAMDEDRHNGQPFPSLGSRDKPVVNTDGTIDLYFGPTAPTGKERNWLRTVPGKGLFPILRLYGPTEASFDNSWKPSDLEPFSARARPRGDTRDRRSGSSVNRPQRAAASGAVPDAEAHTR